MRKTLNFINSFEEKNIKDIKMQLLSECMNHGKIQSICCVVYGIVLKKKKTHSFSSRL